MAMATGDGMVASARSPRAPRQAGAQVAEGTVRVRVAARVRPLLPAEAVGPRRATNCVEVASPTIAVGSNCYAFDHVFDTTATQEEVYTECVEPLVDATFEGVNGTLLAYGQTGSGKTFTMGTSGLPAASEGAVPRALRAIFARAAAEQRAGAGSTCFRVSYVEICTDPLGGKLVEEIRDLLSPGRSRGYASIKADIDGQVRLEGIGEYEVASAEEALGLLRLGSATRATCSTRMNEASSRSHAIFSVEVVQRRFAIEGAHATLTACFQFVDLAGSEKIKLSGVEGEQLSQAININHGLFVLGKVITALTEGHPHVPFRESKLTRLLQNSLGGNSRTCMVACVAPGNIYLAESISTLTYAAKAKEIRNKPVVNRGSSCRNCAALQARLEALESSSTAEASVGPAHGAVMLRSKQAQSATESNATLAAALAASEARAAAAEARASAAEAAAARSRELYLRCSERLAAAAAELPADSEPERGASRSAASVELERLMRLGELEDLESDLDDAPDGSGSCASEGGGASDCEDNADAAWLEREERRKQRLLLQVEENQQSMAVLEAQTQERIRQHEAARDIAERELTRVQAALETARSRQEQLASHQQRYDQRVAALQARNVALEKERKDMQRLRGMQKRQETRLKVLQDSIRNVKEERDALRQRLQGELKRRQGELKRGVCDRRSDQATIKSLSAKVALLERRGSNGNEAGVERASLRRSSSAAYVARRRAPVVACTARPQGDGGHWEKLLWKAHERAARERSLLQGQACLEELQAQLLAATAQRERQALESEVEEDDGAALATAEEEVAAVSAALAYQREQVWMLQSERSPSPGPGPAKDTDLAEEGAQLARGMGVDALVAGIGWLCAEAAGLREAVVLAREARDAAAAQAGAMRDAVAEGRHQISELEHAFDVAHSDYESRVSFLISRLAGEGRPFEQDLRHALGEEPAALLARRVAELEERVEREGREAKRRGQRRLEQDMELITSCQERDSEARLLRSQVAEAEAKAERSVARGAQREAQLLELVSRLEERLASEERVASAGSTPGDLESWGLERLEQFWRSTGLDSNRGELIKALRADVDALCEDRLRDHVQWKRELEEQIGGQQRECARIAAMLREDVEPPPEGFNLLQAAHHWEASTKSLAALRDCRSAELGVLTARIAELHLCLYNTPPGAALAETDEAGALWVESLEKVRQCLHGLEALERERREAVAKGVACLQELWDLLGLQVPEALEEQERTFLQAQLPVSDSCIRYLERRNADLAEMRDQLEDEARHLRSEVDAWRERLAPFEMLVPEDDHDLPLLSLVDALRESERSGGRIALDFVQRERSMLAAFHEATSLASVQTVLEEFERADGLVGELGVLAKRWDQVTRQLSEYTRLSELVTAREALEADMRDFDAEASDPNRFKRRGYSGVEENRRRADYQRRLKVLDASLTASTAEWQQREGTPFQHDGAAYRGAEILPSKHTHMYAWTPRQLSQKQAANFDPPERLVATAAAPVLSAGPSGASSVGACSGRPPSERPVATAAACERVAGAGSCGSRPPLATGPRGGRQPGSGPGPVSPRSPGLGGRPGRAAQPPSPSNASRPPASPGSVNVTSPNTGSVTSGGQTTPRRRMS